MDNQAIIDQFMPLFAPKTVAVIGASTKGGTLPNVFIRRIRELGFSGDIYPIHPSAAEIDGLTRLSRPGGNAEAGGLRLHRDCRRRRFPHCCPAPKAGCVLRR